MKAKTGLFHEMGYTCAACLQNHLRQEMFSFTLDLTSLELTRE